MKYFVMFFFIIFQAQAQECFKYEVKGRVVTHDKKLSLVVHEETMSQHTFSVPESEFMKLAPFPDSIVEGEFLFKNRPQYKDEIVKVLKVKRGLPDPLNPKKHNYLKESGKVPCK